MCTGPFYLTLSGPPDSFPDLNDPTKLRQVATAVHNSLSLPADFPLANILVWIQSSNDVASGGPVPTHRRHLAATTTRVLVLAYTLVVAPGLPPAEQIRALLDAPEATAQIAGHLADAGFVSDEQLGSLQVLVTSVDVQQQVINIVVTGSAGEGAPALTMAVIGEARLLWTVGRFLRALLPIAACLTVHLCTGLKCHQ